MTIRKQDKRNSALDTDGIREGNVLWWAANPMAYDWSGEISVKRGSAVWFDEVDARFVHGARHFGHKERPFDRIIPFEAIEGRRVLEIGCGMGLHTELMLRAARRLCHDRVPRPRRMACSIIAINHPEVVLSD